MIWKLEFFLAKNESFRELHYSNLTMEQFKKRFLGANVSVRLADLGWKKGQLANIPAGTDPRYQAYINKYTNEINALLAAGATLSWLEEKHVYDELKKIPLEK